MWHVLRPRAPRAGQAWGALAACTPTATRAHETLVGAAGRTGPRALRSSWPAPGRPCAAGTCRPPWRAGARGSAARVGAGARGSGRRHGGRAHWVPSIYGMLPCCPCCEVRTHSRWWCTHSLRMQALLALQQVDGPIVTPRVTRPLLHSITRCCTHRRCIHSPALPLRPLREVVPHGAHAGVAALGHADGAAVGARALREKGRGGKAHESRQELNSCRVPYKMSCSRICRPCYAMKRCRMVVLGRCGRRRGPGGKPLQSRS